MATYNKYFTYPGIRVWEDGAWDDVVSVPAPLCRWIEGKNKELGRFITSPDAVQKPPQGFNHKAISDEDRIYWEEKGMRYYACGLGGVSLVPSDYCYGETEEPPIILCLAQGQRKTPTTRIHDLLTYHRDLCEMAAAEKFIVMIAPSDGVDETDNYNQVIQEIASLAHLKVKQIWLDVSTVYLAGATLDSIPGFVLKDRAGNVIEDPDAQVRKIGSLAIPCLDITGIWHERSSQMYCMGHLGRSTFGTLDPGRLAHSVAGKRMAEMMCPEHDFDSIHDPGLKPVWDGLGLSVEFHMHRYDRWISCVPKCALEDPEEKLPLVVIFQDIQQCSPHTPLIAFSQYSGFLTIAGQGDCCLMFFATECKEDNDILSDLLKDYARMYPVDLSRVYIVGHSHNGGLTSQYIRRHPTEIAAVGTLGNRAGFFSSREMGAETMVVDDDEIEFMAEHMDVPTITICGYSEALCQFPLYQENDRNNVDTNVRVWQRRLKAYRCPNQTKEQILACEHSANYVERKLGFPADWSECLYMDGFENYIADVKNVDGKYHMRHVAMGNVPHTVTPAMCDITWNFLRRFARNLETGECVELY